MFHALKIKEINQIIPIRTIFLPFSGGNHSALPVHEAGLLAKVEEAHGVGVPRGGAEKGRQVKRRHFVSSLLAGNKLKIILFVDTIKMWPPCYV
jgi:hypothetical protein